MKNNRYSFWQLLSEKKIIIPIIQRDYAQGREGKEYVRKNFLEQLGKALFDNQPTELDFVYGTEGKDKEKNAIDMFPLDGQQRLTTLWLLHWYVAYKARVLHNVKHVLNTFSYETRTSSREFCKNLCELVYDETNNIENLIKNQTWFFSAWKQDPTIKAMLVMLKGRDNSEFNKGEDFIDGIEELFRSKENVDFKECWEKLTSPECPIKFNFLPLQSNELPVSDDLYIKMNARGKALTSFENFKAELVDWIYKPEHNVFGNLNEDDLDNRRANFVSKIDNNWTDIFWTDPLLSEDISNGMGIGRVDEIFFSFLNRYFYNLVLTEKEQGKWKLKEEKDKYYTYFSTIDQRMLFEDFNLYEYFLLHREDMFESLEKILDNYAESVEKYRGNEPFQDILRSKWNNRFYFIPKYIIKDGNPVTKKDYAGNDFMDFTTFNQMERVVFYAICKYFKEGSIDTDDAISLKHWMRFIWNLVSEYDDEGVAIRNINAMQEAISYIDSIADSHNVYQELENKIEEFIPDSKIDNKNVLGKRFQEEMAKARKILEADDNISEAVIIQAEQYDFFHGAIRFLFTNCNGEIDWTDFLKKWHNIKLLIPAEETETRHCTKKILPYLSDESLKLIFSARHTMNNSDANLIKLLLAYPGHLHEWLMQDNESVDHDSLLHIHLSSLIEKYPDYWIHPEWENDLDVLSDYTYHSGDYQKHSIIIGSDIFTKAIELLSGMQQYGIKITSKSIGTPFKGLYIPFTYTVEGRDYTFRWQACNWVDMYVDNNINLWDKSHEDKRYKRLHTQFNGSGDFKFSDARTLRQELDRCIHDYIQIKDYHLPS